MSGINYQKSIPFFNYIDEFLTRTSQGKCFYKLNSKHMNFLIYLASLIASLFMSEVDSDANVTNVENTETNQSFFHS